MRPVLTGAARLVSSGPQARGGERGKLAARLLRGPWLLASELEHGGEPGHAEPAGKNKTTTTRRRTTATRTNRS